MQVYCSMHEFEQVATVALNVHILSFLISWKSMVGEEHEQLMPQLLPPSLALEKADSNIIRVSLVPKIKKTAL